MSARSTFQPMGHATPIPIGAAAVRHGSGGSIVASQHRRPSPDADDKPPPRRRVDSASGFKAGAPGNAVRLSEMQNGSAPSNFRPPMRAAPPRAMPAAPARTLLEQQRAHQERQPDAAESKASEWTQHWDEEVGSHYYFNSITDPSCSVGYRVESRSKFLAIVGEATWVVQGLS